MEERPETQRANLITTNAEIHFLTIHPVVGLHISRETVDKVIAFLEKHPGLQDQVTNEINAAITGLLDTTILKILEENNHASRPGSGETNPSDSE